MRGTSGNNIRRAAGDFKVRRPPRGRKNLRRLREDLIFFESRATLIIAHGEKGKNMSHDNTRQNFSGSAFFARISRAAFAPIIAIAIITIIIS